MMQEVSHWPIFVKACACSSMIWLSIFGENMELNVKKQIHSRKRGK